MVEGRRSEPLVMTRPAPPRGAGWYGAVLGVILLAAGGGFAAGWFVGDGLSPDSDEASTTTVASVSNAALVWCRGPDQLDDLLAAVIVLDPPVLEAAAGRATESGVVPEWALTAEGELSADTVLTGALPSGSPDLTEEQLFEVRSLWSDTLRVHYPVEYDRACQAAFEIGERTLTWG